MKYGKWKGTMASGYGPWQQNMECKMKSKEYTK